MRSSLIYKLHEIQFLTSGAVRTAEHAILTISPDKAVLKEDAMIICLFSLTILTSRSSTTVYSVFLVNLSI